MRSLLLNSIVVAATLTLGLTLGPAWCLQSKETEPTAPPGMALVPKGAFYLGDTEEELTALFKQIEKKNPANDYWTSLIKPADQRAQLQSPAFLDKTEVTNAQYDLFLKATGEKPPAVQVDDKRILSDWEPTADGKGYQLKKGRENHPVYGVSFFEAQAFARWAGKRLPTEQEWERAARGDDKRRYPWGNQWDDRKYCNSALYGANDTTPVGAFPEGASPFGALDMAGNVWEWTSTVFDLYPGNTKQTGAEGGITIRGGGFPQVASAIRASVRQGLPPTFRTNALGFRCAKSLQPAVDTLELTAEGLRGIFPPEFLYDPKSGVGVEKTEYASSGGLITRYAAVGLVPRKDTPFNSQKMLETEHKNKKLPVPLFVFRTDVDLENPKIPAGQYLVSYDAPGSVVVPAAAAAEAKDAAEEKKAEGEKTDEKAPPPAPAEGGEKDDKTDKADKTKKKADDKKADKKAADAKKKADADKKAKPTEGEAAKPAEEAGKDAPADAATDAAAGEKAKEGGDAAAPAAEPVAPVIGDKSSAAQDVAAEAGALSKESKTPRLVFIDSKGKYRAEIPNPVFGSEPEAQSEVTLDAAKGTLVLRAVPRFRLSGKQLVFEHTFNVKGW